MSEGGIGMYLQPGRRSRWSEALGEWIEEEIPMTDPTTPPARVTPIQADRARELLAAEYEKNLMPMHAQRLRKDGSHYGKHTPEPLVLRAIEAALSEREQAVRDAAKVALTTLDDVYREWDGEPEDMVPVQEARALLRAALSEPAGERTVEEAAHGLRCWLSAGEDYAKRGGSTIPLDGYVGVALLEYDARRGHLDEHDVRPTPEHLEAVLSKIEGEFDDALLGPDLRILHAHLKGAAFTAAPKAEDHPVAGEPVSGLEQEAFVAANHGDVPDFAKETVKSLWREVCRLNALAHPAPDALAEMREAVGELLDYSGARGTYNALKYADAVKRIEALLATEGR